MQRMFVFLLFVLSLPVRCMANPAENAFANADFDIVSGKITTNNNQILQGVGNFDDDSVVIEIENVLRNKAPELVSKMQGETNDVKLTVYRSKLAELAFDEYEQSFIDMLKYRSKETGREFKKDEITYGCKRITHYWLDRGELDTSKCVAPDSSPKAWVDWITKNACFYPDDFEEHSISIKRDICDSWKRKDDWSFGEMFVIDDYKDKNIRISYNIGLSSHGIIHSVERFLNLFLQIINTSVDYDKYHAWRNQEVADIRSGMYEYVGETSSDGETLVFEVDYSKNWPSRDNPVTHIRSKSIMYDHSFKFESNWLADE